MYQDTQCLKIAVFNALKLQEFMEHALDAVPEKQVLSYHAPIVKLSVDFIHFYFQDAVSSVQDALKLIKTDFAKFAKQVSMQKITFVILVMLAAQAVSIVIIALTAILDIIGQLQMEVYVLLVPQDVLLVQILEVKYYVSLV